MIPKEDQIFKCLNCQKQVSFSHSIGTKHRNHCPLCLYSQHVDLNISGDRKSTCKGKMMPIGITLKHEGVDKYGRKREGEIMIIHQCLECNKISINRVAGDDSTEEIMGLFERSHNMDKDKQKELEDNNIKVLEEKEKDIIYRQLFGKNKNQE